MLLFCPTCSNMLIVSVVPIDNYDGTSNPDGNKNRLECRSCPYQFIIEQPIYEKKTFKPKKPDDVMGGDESNAHMERTEIACKNDKCESMEAMFWQAQIRSADEPMTSFYQCVRCGRKWQEN